MVMVPSFAIFSAHNSLSRPLTGRPILIVYAHFSNRIVSNSERGLKFKQVFKNNMGTKSEPAIAATDKEDFTRITFKPDLARFGMDVLDQDIVALLTRRVYDIAGLLLI